MHRRPDAVILCGGAGTRLRALTYGPKSMVSFGGRPFLEILLRQLRRWGVGRVFLAIGYQGDAIQRHFGDEAFGLQIVYSPELNALGTGGALRNAANLVTSPTVLVLNGDSYTDADLNRFISDHTKTSADVSVLVVPPDGREDCGTVSVDPEGRLLDFQEKRPGAAPTYANSGIYLFSREILFGIPSGIQISLERELIPKWLAEGKQIRAICDPALCYDIGTPERHQNAEAVLTAVQNDTLAPQREESND